MGEYVTRKEYEELKGLVIKNQELLTSFVDLYHEMHQQTIDKFNEHDRILEQSLAITKQLSSKVFGIK